MTAELLRRGILSLLDVKNDTFVDVKLTLNFTFFSFLKSLNNLCFARLTIDSASFPTNYVRENTEIIVRSDNWLKLSFLESLAIKEQKPELNRGLKSCKELQLF